MGRRRLGWVARAGFLSLALALSLVAFRLGVGVSAREGVERAALLEQLYYALGLFVFGGMDLGVPRGGPDAARAALWLSYFLSPAITTTAVVEGILRLAKPARLQRLARRNHVVIVGSGRLGQMCLDAVRHVSPRIPIVCMDKEGRDDRRAQAERMGAEFVVGDIRQRETRYALALHRARLVIFATSDDLVNLEGAWNASDELSGQRIVVHVADIALSRERPPLPAGSVTFNAHRMGARFLFEEHLVPRFSETTALDQLVLVGFGRLGQTVLEQLRTLDMAEHVSRIVIVDRDAASKLDRFERQVDCTGTCPRSTVDGDVADPRVLDRALAIVEDAKSEPAFVLGTDDDLVNVRVAMALRERVGREAPIFVRSLRASRFVTRLGEHGDICVLAMEQRMREALRAEVVSWLDD